MNCAPTLTTDEFKTIHNALCDLDSITRQLEDILKPELYTKLAKSARKIREGLAGAYKQDDDAFSRKSRHYDSVKSELGLKNSEWSEYDVDNMSDRHPFEGVERVVYESHWGEDGPTSSTINGLTWAALWVAADACIRDSGDEHHVFIEQFRVRKEDPKTLVLYTGS
jgi:hypothetical protein